MELIRRFSAEAWAAALQDWAWLPGLTGARPLVASSFGDAFLQGPDGVWFLDVAEGTLTREWDDVPALEAALNTRAGQDRFLLAGLAVAAAAAGMEPAGDQILCWKTPPILGGDLTLANVEIGDLAVSLSLAGQLHRQVKDLPPGAHIGSVTVVDA